MDASLSPTTIIPQVIPFASVDLGNRLRTEYRGIEGLAESIEAHGLIQPIVLSPVNTVDGGVAYTLVAGGRRYHALQLLGVDTLHHSVSAEPGRYGFVLKGEEGTEISNLLVEIAENQHRHDVDWRDELKAIYRACLLLERDAFSKGHRLVRADLGYMLGVNYADIDTAKAVYSDLVANPKDYEACTGLRASLQVLLKKNQKALEKLLVENSFVKAQAVPKPEAPIADGTGSKIVIVPDLSVQPPVVIPLTSRVFHTSGLRYLMEHAASVDHIICDPDFAVSTERLEAGVSGAAEGVAQADVATSLGELQAFFPLAFGAIRDRGFLVMFLDLDHWEKLQGWATAAGFAVQRWPLIWHKTDYRSNASPQSNFCKNIEYAMVCRKPGSVLTGPQMSSIFACPTGPTTKEFGHPFAKPRALWHWLFAATCIKGQTVLDPFAGSGSSTVSAIEWGLNPIACEIQEQHYNTLVLNCQKEYKKLVGENVEFV